MNTDEAKVPNDGGNWQSMEIFLFSNGQQYSPPRKYHLEAEDLIWWDATLNHLARKHYGVQHSLINLYTTDGRLVEAPLELKDGQAYVAVKPLEQFIDTGYQKYLIRATRSWEKRQAKKKTTDIYCSSACEHGQPCCLCPVREGPASPEPLMPATGLPQMRPAGGHFMSSVQAKPVAVCGNYPDDYGTVSNKLGDVVDEPVAKSDEYDLRSGQHEARSGEYGSRSGIYEGRLDEYNSTRPGVYDAISGEHGTKPGEYDARPDKYKDKPGEYTAKSVENGPEISKNRTEIVKNEARFDEERARINDYEPNPGSGGVRSSGHKPKLNEYEIGTNIEGHETSLNECEDTARSNKHRPTLGKYGDRPGKGEVRTDENAIDDYGPRLEKHEAKFCEHRAISDEHKDSSSKYRPSTGESGSKSVQRGQSGENRPKSTDRRVSQDSGKKIDEQASRPYKLTSVPGERGKSNELDIRTGKNRRKSGENEAMKDNQKNLLYEQTDSKGENRHEENELDRKPSVVINSCLDEVALRGSESDYAIKLSRQNSPTSNFDPQPLTEVKYVNEVRECECSLHRDRDIVERVGEHRVIRGEQRGRGSDRSIAGKKTNRDVDNVSTAGEQGSREIEHTRRLSGQKAREIEHSDRTGEHKNREIEHSRRPSGLKTADTEYGSRTGEQKSREIEHTRRPSSQRGREIEHSRRLNGHRTEDIAHSGKTGEQRNREIKDTRRSNQLRAGEIDNRSRVGEPIRREIEHVDRVRDPRALENSARVDEQIIRESYNEHRRSDLRTRQRDHAARVGDHEARGGDFGVRLGDREVENLGPRAAEPTARATTPGPRENTRDKISSKEKMVLPRLGVPGIRVDKVARLSESEEVKTRVNIVNARVVEPGVGGTGAAGVSNISEAQQHVRKSSMSTGKPSTEKKRSSFGQHTSPIKKPSPFPISSIPQKKNEDKNPVKNIKDFPPKKLVGKSPVAASNELVKPKAVPKYLSKRIALPAVPPPTASFDHSIIKRKSTSDTNVMSNQKSSAPVKNVIGNKGIFILSNNLFRNPESEIRSMRLDSVKHVDDGTRNSSYETQTELIGPKESLASTAVSEAVQTYTEQIIEVVNQFKVSTHSNARVGCTLSNQRDNMVATDDLDDNYISILNKGDVVNLKLVIEVRNGEKITNSSHKNFEKSRSLTNITRTEEGSRISIDDDMYVQSKSLQAILNNEYFQGNGFEGRPKILVVQCACCSNAPKCNAPTCCDSKKYFVLLPNSMHDDMDNNLCNCEPPSQSYSQKIHLQFKKESACIPVKDVISDISLETLKVSGLPLQEHDLTMLVTTSNSICQTEEIKSECLVTKQKVNIIEDGSSIKCEFKKESSTTIESEYLVIKNSSPKTCPQICSQISEPLDLQVCSHVQSQEYSQLCPQIKSAKVQAQRCPGVCSETCPLVQLQTCPPVQSPGCPQTCPQGQPQRCPQICQKIQSRGCPQICAQTQLQGCPPTCPNVQPQRCPKVCQKCLKLQSRRCPIIFPQIQSQKCPHVQSQECPQVQSQRCPQVQSQGCPQVQSQGCPQVQSQGCPQVQSQGCPQVQSQGCPQVQSQGCPRVQSQGCPRVQSQGCPRVQSQGCPQVQSQGCPQVKSQGGPQACTQVQSQVCSMTFPQIQSQGCPPIQSQGCLQICPQVQTQGYSQNVSVGFTQTQWCNVLLEARLNDDGRYSFHLPPLHVLKHYSF